MGSYLKFQEEYGDFLRIKFNTCIIYSDEYPLLATHLCIKINIMKKNEFSLNDVRVVMDDESLSESDMSDIIGGISSSSSAGCESCNCWFGNTNKEKKDGWD